MAKIVPAFGIFSLLLGSADAKSLSSNLENECRQDVNFILGVARVHRQRMRLPFYSKIQLPYVAQYLGGPLLENREYLQCVKHGVNERSKGMLGFEEAYDGEKHSYHIRIKDFSFDF